MFVFNVKNFCVMRPFVSFINMIDKIMHIVIIKQNYNVEPLPFLFIYFHTIVNVCRRTVNFHMNWVSGMSRLFQSWNNFKCKTRPKFDP